MNKKILLELSLAEGEGVGMWYEYLAKLRLYPKAVKKTLVFGLPEKYGLGIDALWFLKNGAELTVMDTRPEVLAEFAKMAQDFFGEVKLKTKLVSRLASVDLPDNDYDLVISSEVLQQYENYDKIISEMVRVSKKYVLFFLSNAACYAHPKFSGLKSRSLDEVKQKVNQFSNIDIKKAGYVDIPPWPSGIQVQQQKDGQASFKFKVIKAVAKIIIPILAWKERFIPPPLRQKLAHFIYFSLEKKI